MIYLLPKLSPSVLLLNTLIHKQMWEKITQFYHSINTTAQTKKKMSDSSHICDYQFLSIIITYQSTNIEN